jgi:tetratricopeptide (TPR) repeat protein
LVSSPEDKLLEAAQLFEKVGDLERAARIYVERAEKYKGSYKLAAKTYEENGNLEEAIKYYKKEADLLSNLEARGITALKRDEALEKVKSLKEKLDK